MTREEIQREVHLEKLHDEVVDLFVECAFMDEGVARYFDMESMKNLSMKKRVLTRIKNGEHGPDIGAEYFDILEDIPRDKKGNVNIPIEW